MLRPRGAGGAPCFALPRVVWRLIVALPMCLPLIVPPSANADDRCEAYRVTGYVRGHHSPWTYDGTSVWTQEAIAAASWNLPIGTVVKVDGLGKYRIADRGSGLGARHIDVLVDNVQTAHELTSVRTVCLVPPKKPSEKKPKSPKLLGTG